MMCRGNDPLLDEIPTDGVNEICGEPPHNGDIDAMLDTAKIFRRLLHARRRQVWVYLVRFIPYLPFVIPGVMPYASLKILATTQFISDNSGVTGWPILFILLNTTLGLTTLQLVNWPLERLKRWLLGPVVRRCDTLVDHWDDLVSQLKDEIGPSPKILGYRQRTRWAFALLVGQSRFFLNGSPTRPRPTEERA